MEIKRGAFALATFAVGLGLFRYYGWQLEREAQGGEFVHALVAARNLELGQTLDASALASVKIPDGYLDERRVLAADRKKLKGARVVTTVKAGQAVMWSDVSSAEGPRQLSLLVAPGRRAYTLAASTNPFSHLLRVGDRVDVLLSSGKGARTLLENLRVLAVGMDLGVSQSKDGNTALRGKSGVTLDVSRTEAEELLAAEAHGPLQLVLRNPVDVGLHRSQGATRKQNKPDAVAKALRQPEIDHVR